ncbi:competence type IV pilus minor pilin ComGD [Filibacter tadaridae]|uniref:competence type IV pilus minor pilin ComGD n=1 Tax=Filibacter tadaridae TaxID=2483811 RepID=UPI00135C1325|nr:competence type IV pilus minor pilin ComGD [Filibacter tadaridae]
MEKLMGQAVANKSSGFTFLELLLVLSVVSIMTVIIIPLGDKWIRTTTEEAALQSLIASIHNLQAYSIANNVRTRLQFTNSGTTYITSVQGGSEFARTTFPKGMKYISSSSIKYVDFYSNGDIAKFGVLAIGTSSGTINITFQFQRGRMILHKG